MGVPDTATGVAAVVAGILGMDPSEMRDEHGPATLGQWTSRKHIELVVRLEEAYGIAFTHDEIFDIRSFGDLWEILRRKGVQC